MDNATEIETDFTDPDEEPDPDEILAKAIDGLDKSYELVYVDYRDGLNDEQIVDALAGNWEAVEESVDEWADEARRESAWQVAEELLDEDDLVVLRTSDGDQMDELLIAIEERDESDVLAHLLRYTSNHLLRYKLDYELAPDSWNWTDEEVETAAREIAECAGIDYETNHDELQSMVTQASYGGELHVIWNGAIDEIVLPIFQLASAYYRHDASGATNGWGWRIPTHTELDKALAAVTEAFGADYNEVPA